MDRVLIVTNSLSGGGAEYAAELLYEELRQRQHNIFWIGINSENPRKIPTDERKISLDRDKSKGVIGTVFGFVRYIRFIFKNKISTIIINCELPELYSAFVPKRLNLIVVEHANPSWFGREFLGKIVRTMMRFRSSTFVVVGKHLTPRFIGSNSFLFVPNPIPHQNIESKVEVSGEIRRLLYVGRLSPHFKNPHKVVSLGIKCNLPSVLVGDGPLREELENSAIELKADATFLGFQEFPWEFYRDGDLLIIPSSAEGDGLVLIEAMINGVPFLASDIPDFNRYGIDKINYCVDLAAFYERIQQNRHQIKKLVVPSKLVENIVEERSLIKIADKWESIINNLEVH